MFLRTRRAQVTALVFALVVALAGLGLGYGLWSKVLTVNATVETGDVDAEWTSCLCNDLGLDPDQEGGTKDKDVGSTTCSIDEGDPQILHFLVQNGYPSYFVDCQVEFTNTGTIPVIIEDWRMVNLDFTPASAKDANDGPVWVHFVDGVGAQVDPGVEQGSSLKIHVEQMAEELAEYNFDIEVCLRQWNEDGTCW